jgi:hypothetical protein
MNKIATLSWWVVAAVAALVAVALLLARSQ